MPAGPSYWRRTSQHTAWNLAMISIMSCILFQDVAPSHLVLHGEVRYLLIDLYEQTQVVPYEDLLFQRIRRRHDGKQCREG